MQSFCQQYDFELPTVTAAQAEDLGGLLGGDFLVAVQDADRLAVAECVGDPLERSAAARSVRPSSFI